MKTIYKRLIYAVVIIVIVVVAAVLIYDNYGRSDEVVSIGYLPSDHDSALYVANATGMYKDQGIEVELHEYNNGGDVMSAIASGTVDVGYLGITPTLAGIQQGVPVKIAAGAQLEGSGLVTNDPSIETIEDLQGKTVATPGESSIQYMLLQYALNKSGMSMNDISDTSMKVASMSDALRTGSIDAMITYEPYVSVAHDVDNMTVIETSGEIIPDHPCCVMVVSDSFADNRPDTAKKMIDINNEATDKLKENASSYIDCLPESVVPDKNSVSQSLDQMVWVGELNETYKNNIRDFMNIEKDMGLINDTFTDDQLFYEPER